MPASSRTQQTIAGLRAGGASYLAIARKLNADRVPTASGHGQWHPASARAAMLPGYWAQYGRIRRAR